MNYIRDIGQVSAGALELAGIAIIVAAAILATVNAIAQVAHREPREAIYPAYRSRLGRGILLGLEFLVAADIINTVAVELTYHSVGVLAVIVLIRTFLSFTLELETTGRWPWQSR